MAIARYLIVSMVCLSAYNAYAGNSDTSAAEKTQPQYVDYDGDNGLVTNIPTPDTEDLLLQVWQLNNSLQTKKEKIAKSVKDSEFSAKDGVITAVIPGGLLYAAHKKFKHNNEKKKLAKVESKLDEMTEDLEKLRSDVIFEPELVMLDKKP